MPFDPDGLNYSINFTENDHFNNLKHLVTFAYMCELFKDPSTRPLVPQSHRRHPKRRLSTNTYPSPAVALASVGMLPKTVGFCQMCKALNNTHILEITNINDDLVNRVLWKVLAMTPKLTILNLSGCTQLDDTTVETITQNCQGLIHLDIGCCIKVTNTMVRKIGENCTQLCCLDISSVKVTTQVIEWLNALSHLKSIGIGITSCMNLNKLQTRGIQIETKLKCVCEKI